MNALGELLTGVIRAYQYVLRPFIGQNCRFVPGCSDYTIEAIRIHGLCRGSGLAFKRILRCNPWHEGGIDPVPPSCVCCERPEPQ